jgi:hypothetical protein
MVSVPHRSPLAMITKIGLNVDDAPDIRLQKSLLVAGSFMFIAAGALWGIAYIMFRQPLAGMIPLSYAVISFASVVYFSITHHYRLFRLSQLLLILFLPFILMLALGGFVNSSAVILWSFICPLGALLFAEYRQSPLWLIAYLALVVLSGFLQSLDFFNQPITAKHGDRILCLEYRRRINHSLRAVALLRRTERSGIQLAEGSTGSLGSAIA